MKENFEFNPFSGVFNGDIAEILVPSIDFEKIIININNSDSLAIEFIGKQGRGKTTHLVYLHQHMTEYPIFLLNSHSSFSEIINHPSPIVFVDSIHHLNIFNRIRLFNQKKIVIYTTHWSRKIDCLFSNKEHYSYKFKGISPKKLNTILNKRLTLAANKKVEFQPISVSKTEQLIKQFGDNYRAIINHLYETYQ